MVLVAVVAFALFAEPIFYKKSVQMVSSDGGYSVGEALAVWLLLNSIFVGLPVLMLWDVARHRD
jgi:hypothetical protein